MVYREVPLIEIRDCAARPIIGVTVAGVAAAWAGEDAA